MVLSNTEEMSGNLSSLDEPPDSALGSSFRYSPAKSVPLDYTPVNPSTAKSSLNSPYESSFTHTHPHTISPHSATSSVATDATTPKFGYSPGCTDSPPGSPSSMSSVMSSASYRRGELADTEDEHEPELSVVTETAEDDLDTDLMDSLVLQDEAHPTHATSVRWTPSYAISQRPVSPGPPASKPRKGRVFELLLDGEDSSRTSSPVPTPAPHEWDGEIVEPPPPQPPVTALDTQPAVPSPLCVCIQPSDVTEETSPDRAGAESSSDQTMSDAQQSDLAATIIPPKRRSSLSALSRKPLKSALCDAGGPDVHRGRSRERKKRSVRFCTKPPEERRTHSPVEYDRKALPVHQRLDRNDLLELRDLHMPMDLLSSRWSSLRLPCRTKVEMSDDHPSLPAYRAWHNIAMNHVTPNPQPTPATGPAPFSGWETPVSTEPAAPMVVEPAKYGSSPTPDPLADLEAARERQRQLRGPGPMWAGSSSTESLPSSSSTLASTLAERFGLNKPPPPLPGVSAASGPPSAIDVVGDPLRRASSDTTLLPATNPVLSSRSSAPSMVRNSGVAPPSRDHVGMDSPVADLGESGTEYDVNLAM